MAIKEYFQNHWPEILFSLIVLAIAFVLIRAIRWGMSRYINRRSVLMKMDPTNFRFLKHSVSAIIFGVAIVVIVYNLPGGKGLAVSMFAGAGVFAAIIGFASQAAFSNIVSGIFIVVFKPFRVEDWIELGAGQKGIVEDITLRHTVIRDFQNQRIIIPNSSISADTIVNFSISDPKICRHLEIGISYDSNIQLARTIMQEEALKHPFCIDNRTQKEKADGRHQVRVRVIGFGDSSVNLRAYVWAQNPEKAWDLLTDLNEAIKRRFDAEGIEIPFPYRTLVYKKDLEPNA